MFVKSVLDSSGQSLPSVNTVQRSTLAVSPAADTAELPDVAVARSSSGQSIPQGQHDLDRHTHVIGKLRSSVQDALEKRRAIEELDELRAKILRGGGESAVDEAFRFGKDDDGDINTELLLGSSPEEKAKEVALSTNLGKTEPQPPKRISDPSSVLNKIDDALGRISQLKDKLGRDEDDAYNRLLTFNVTVSGLNVARTQVTDSEYSISAASAAVESIMTNLRSAVIAHGGTSADVVRLVLAG